MEKVPQLPTQLSGEQPGQKPGFELTASKAVAALVFTLVGADVGIVADRAANSPELHPTPVIQEHPTHHHKQHLHHKKHEAEPAPKPAITPTAVTQHHATHRVKLVTKRSSEPTPRATPHSLAPTAKKEHVHRAPLTFLEELQSVLRSLTDRLGIDVSYPNKKNLVPDYVSYGTVGVNYGQNYSENPYLKKEVRRFHNRPVGLYANTDFPGTHELLTDKKRTPSWVRKTIKKACPQLPKFVHKSRKVVAGSRDIMCVAETSGRLAGQQDVLIAEKNGVYSRDWNLDIEFMKHPLQWTKNKLANRASIRAEVKGIMAQAKADHLARPRIRFYSTGYMYGVIAGLWHNRHKVWAAAGHTTVAEAMTHCSDNFTGAGVDQVQLVTSKFVVYPHNQPERFQSQDVDITCP